MATRPLQLRYLAHARSGDKGNTANVGLIALEPEYYSLLQREVTTFRGKVRSGNSGGPLVDADGHVMGTVFAAAVGAGPDGGYAVPNAIVRKRLRAAGGGRVGTGPCAR